MIEQLHGGGDAMTFVYWTIIGILVAVFVAFVLWVFHEEYPGWVNDTQRARRKDPR